MRYFVNLKFKMSLHKADSLVRTFSFKDIVLIALQIVHRSNVLIKLFTIAPAMSGVVFNSLVAGVLGEKKVLRLRRRFL